MKFYPGFKQKRGAENPGWKGENAVTGSIHCWIRDNWGRPKVCEHCGSTTAKMYDWSSKDHLYSRDRKDWQRLCRSCHLKYDKKFNGRKWYGLDGRWSLKHNACIDCGRNKVKHKSRGRCSNCYIKHEKRRKTLESF